MPLSKRPYFRSQLNELRRLFASHQNDLVVLAALADELGHRETRAAVALQSEVQRRIAELERMTVAPAAPEQSGRSDPTRRRAETGSDNSTVRPNRSDGTAGARATRLRSSPSSDEYLRPPQRLKRIEPPGVAGRPPKYVRSPKTDLALDLRADMPRTARYALALGALVADMRRQRQGSRQITLEEGQQIELDRGHFGYSFAFTEDAEIFEDARVELRLGPRTINGQIASISDGRIIIAVEEDLGEIVAHCILVIDNTALLEALKERLEQGDGNGRSLNTKLADDVVSGTGRVAPAEPALSSTILGDRNEGQLNAICLALANEVSYVWGPPGTGKTTTLSILIRELFDRKKRLLICSNTNQAVDQVLLNLCQKLGRDHPAMENGQIVRLGRIVHEELKRQYAGFVTLDGIVERRSRDLRQRKTDLETSLAGIARRSEATEALLSRFRELDGVRAAIAEANQDVAELKGECDAAVRRGDGVERRLGDLGLELEKTRAAGTIRRAFLRSEKTIIADIEQAGSSKVAAEREATELLNRCRILEQKAKGLIDRSDDLTRSLRTADRAVLQRQIDTFAAERQPLLNELAGVNKALADIEAGVMRDAAVIGATVTKAYLSAKDLPAFDVVIVDEASMVLLPALYFAAGLAREKVVVSGDFRQLPPIVQTDQKAIIDEIGNDVFEAAGVTRAVDDGRTDPRMAFLKEQYRMHRSICDLISAFMYRGKLRTSVHVEERPIEARDPLTGPLTIVDTSSLWPFETQTTSFSRYNLVHALVVRNLVQQLHEAGNVQDGQALGVCTPYSAQAKLIRRLIEDENDLKGIVYPGTVHRYQGDEKTAIIIDIPESVGGSRFIGRFLQGDHPSDDGAKLLNVAVSRAREHLVIVANLTYLDGRLPSGALLRDMLFKMQAAGRILDAREILTLRSADLRGLGRPVNIDVETQRTGLFGQKDFDTVFCADVARATESIVLFSGFVTPERVGSYGDLFRQRILDGVRIRCVTRPPQYNGSISPERGKEALDALEGIGAIVDCRKDIHQKIVIVDNRIVWFGSLNPLSHTAKTDEVMMRTLAPGFASELARQVSIRAAKRDGDDGSASAQAENPRCAECGSRTFYLWSNRRRRPFFVCEDECGWVQDATSGPARRPRQSSTDVRPANGPPCPKCGHATRRRQGPYGTFFGCSRYPKCDGRLRA